MSASRDKYRNPYARAVYVCGKKPQLKLKDGLVKIDGVICQFILPMIEVGLFETTKDFSKFVINSDSEDEVLEVPVVPKVPTVIDLDVGNELSEPQTQNEQSHPTKQVPAVTENCKSLVETKGGKNITKCDVSPSKKNDKKVKNDELPARASSVRQAEDSERLKSSPIHKKDSPKEVSIYEDSPKRKPVDKKQESYNSDDSAHSPKWSCKYEGSPRRSRKDKREDYSSDGSIQSAYSRRSGKDHRKHSSSQSSSVENKVDIKQDQDDENLFGKYHCKHCNATMNSLANYETHLSGKRHLKNLKLKNVVETVQKTLQPFQIESKYPPPPPGMYRARVRSPAKIQDIVQCSLKKPCPGLDYVIEIQGRTETTYYCELCSAPCSTATIISHLTGYRHLLQCLKHFDYDRYEAIRDKKKFEVERNLEKWLKDIERHVGRGKIAVEKEVPIEKDSQSTLDVKNKRRIIENLPGSSYGDPEDSFPEHYSDTTIPDTSKADFYCKTCDSHMNNVSMWDMHIRGKRHLANIKKAPGQLPSKAKTVLLPNTRAKIMSEIDLVEEPVVGLSNMREVQNPDAPGELYNCFLCGACLTRRDVVEHILSLKHKKKYLEKINHPEMSIIKEMNMLDSDLYSVIEEICDRVEDQLGRGVMEVHIVKNALASGRPWQKRNIFT